MGFKPGDEDVELERRPVDEDPLSVLAFKIASDPHLGKLTFVRVYSGVLKAGEQVVLEGSDRLREGGKVEVVATPAEPDGKASPASPAS